MTFADAVTGSDGRPLDQIRLTGVTATGYHGVLPQERAQGQTFRADVVLHLDSRAAAGTDDLAATVSYAEVAEDVHDVLAGPPVDLVETLAERIAAVVLDHPAVQAVDVRVHKPQAPISVPFDDVEIVVRRDREHRPVVPAFPAEPSAQASPSRPVPEAADLVVPPPPVPPQPATSTPASAPVPAPVSSAVPSAGSARSAGSVPTPAVAEPTVVEPAVVEPVAADSPPVVSAPVEAVAIAEPEDVPAPAVDPLDAVPEAPVDAVLALGANLGDAQATLRAAVTDIDRVAGVQVMEVSPLARTVAVGPEQPDYLNAVLLVRTTLPARDLLSACQEVELMHGRVREERWGPRTLDVDLVQYDDLTAAAEDLELPHPRAHERAFVLVPWAEVDPQGVLGGLGGGPVAQLAATAPDRSGIRWLALDWLIEPAATGAVPAQPAQPPRPAPPARPEPPRQDQALPDPEAAPQPLPMRRPASPPQAPPAQASPQAPPTSAFPAQAPPPAQTPPSGEVLPPEEYAPVSSHEQYVPVPHQDEYVPLPQQDEYAPHQDRADELPPSQEPRGFVAAAGVHAPIPPAPDEHPERS